MLQEWKHYPALKDSLFRYYDSVCGYIYVTHAFHSLSIHFADFQVVFVSSDKSEEEMRNYMRGKPWPGIRIVLTIIE